MRSTLSPFPVRRSAVGAVGFGFDVDDRASGTGGASVEGGGTRRTAKLDDLNATALHAAGDEGTQPTFDELAGQGDQAGEAHGVGEKAGRQQKRACEEDDRPIHQGLSGHLASLGAGLNLGQDAEALLLGQSGTDDAREDDQSEGRQYADDGAHLNEERQLDGRHDDEKEREKAHRLSLGTDPVRSKGGAGRLEEIQLFLRTFPPQDGVAVGETAEAANDVSVLHGVTMVHERVLLLRLWENMGQGLE